MCTAAARYLRELYTTHTAAILQRIEARVSRCLQPPCLRINRNHHWVRDILRLRGNGHLVAERGQRLRTCGDILAVVQLKRRRRSYYRDIITIGISLL